MQKGIVTISAFLFISLFFLSCSRDQEGIIQVNNMSPKFVDKDYVELEKLYDIDVTKISLFSKDSGVNFYKFIDFDENNNLYILDSYENKIWVFDENGSFVRSFGRKGQGPEEFLNTNAMIIKRDKIYVFQGFFEYKIVSLNGEYISSNQCHIQNWLKFENIGDNFYVFNVKLDQTFTNMDFILSVFDEKFSAGREIFKYKYPPGIHAPNYNLIWADWVLITEKGEFYFPEDNQNKYSLIKYNQMGSPTLKIERKYQIKEYSKEAFDLFNSIYEKKIRGEMMEFPRTPPVVRKMFLDKKNNLWVISGETYEDNENPEFENTIDLFNEKGEWLYSFQSQFISKYCFYNNGKIYRVLPIKLDSFNQYIEVYQIEY